MTFVLKNGVYYVAMDGENRVYSPQLMYAEKFLRFQLARDDQRPNENIRSLKMEIDKYELIGNNKFR